MWRLPTQRWAGLGQDDSKFELFDSKARESKGDHAQMAIKPLGLCAIVVALTFLLLAGCKLDITVPIGGNEVIRYFHIKGRIQ